MASYNRVVLVGNLTRDPELRYIPSGTAVADIGLAVNDRVKRGDDWVDDLVFGLLEDEWAVTSFVPEASSSPLRSGRR